MHQLFDKLLNWKNDLIKLYIFLFFYMYNPKTEQHYQFVKKPFNSEHNSTGWHICTEIWTKKVPIHSSDQNFTGGHSCVEIRNKKVQKNTLLKLNKAFQFGGKTFNFEQHFLIENKTLKVDIFSSKVGRKEQCSLLRRSIF